MMDTLVFVIAGFLVALFAALCTVYFFIYRPRTKEKRKQLLKKIGYLAVAGTIVVCLLALILSLLRNGSEFKEIHSRLTSNDSLSVSRKDLSNLEDKSQDYNTTNKTFANGHEQEALDYRYLNEEQIRKEISESLKIENVNNAITLLDYLPTDDAKDEERKHIFNYCMKNGKLEKAKELAELFQSPSKREEANKQLALEMLKIKR